MPPRRNYWPFIFLLSAGCVAKPLYLTPLPEHHFDHAKLARHAAMRKHLALHYQAEANKRVRAEALLQMSQSKTNYPPFKK